MKCCQLCALAVLWGASGVRLGTAPSHNSASWPAAPAEGPRMTSPSEKPVRMTAGPAKSDPGSEVVRSSGHELARARDGADAAVRSTAAKGDDNSSGRLEDMTGGEANFAESLHGSRRRLMREGQEPQSVLMPESGEATNKRSEGAGLWHPLPSHVAALFGLVSALFLEHPYGMSFVVCFAKGIAADSVMQRWSPTAEAAFSARRCLAFGCYGGAYQGCCQYYILNVLFDRLFGDGTSMKVAITKAMAENFVHAPLLCLPAYYMVKSTVFGKLPMEGLRQYVCDVRHQGLLLSYWSVWLPVNCVTFSVVPEHLRIAWIASVSFFWLMILSSTSAAGDSARKGQLS